MTWLMVAVGGALGSVARYSVTQALMRAAGNPVPYATAIVNIAGCAAAGALLGAIAGGRLPLTLDQRSLVFAGLLGGFTTFSGVGIDTLTLVQEGRRLAAVANVTVQVAVGLAALAVAYAIARR